MKIGRKIIFSKPARILFGLILSLLAFYLAFRSLTVQELVAVFAEIKWSWVSLSLVLMVGHHLVKVIRWQVLLERHAKGIGFRPLFASLMISQMINLVVPARAGDITRIQQIGTMGPGRSFVLITLLLEKVFDMVAYGVLFMALLISITLPQWIQNTGILFLMLSGFLFASLVFIFRYRAKIFQWIQRITHKFPLRYRDIFITKYQTMVSALTLVENGKVISMALFWTAVTWSVSILTNYCLLLAMDLTLSWTAPLFILVGLQAGISIPSVPMKIGIFEYVCVLVLGFYGIDQATGVSYGILLHLIVMVPILGTGLYYMIQSDRIFRPRTGTKMIV
jgi:hypothetical protein